MAAVFGLGNPGEGYALTRHNVGFRVLDELRSRWRARPGERSAEYREWVAEYCGKAVALVQPLTFMNESGAALKAWRERRAADDAELLVVADDVYLPVGFVRLRRRGSSGGHRGLASIEAALGTANFARLRVGIGAVESQGLRGYVLDEPAAAEAEAMQDGIRVAADAVECWLDEGILAAMNQFNRRVRREASES